MRGYLPANNNDRYFQGETFGKILKYVQQHSRTSRLKDTKDKLQVIFENVDSVDKAKGILESVLQLAGAMIITSAHRPSITWLAHVSSSASWTSTLFLLRVASVRGDTKSLAAGVRITFTSAPATINNLVSSIALYAAMLPVIPKRIFLPLNILQVTKNDSLFNCRSCYKDWLD